MTRDAVRTDQLRAGRRRLPDHFKVVREGGNAGQDRIEERLRGWTPRKGFGKPFQLSLVILEEHSLLGWKMPKEGAFGNAGFPGQLGYRHIRKSLAGEAF